MIKINMLSSADKVKGQGVGSAYLEQVELMKSSKKFKIFINSNEECDILHFHTIHLKFYFKLLFSKKIKVIYVHFLPHTLDGSIKLPKLIFNIFKKYVISFYKKADYLVVVNPIFIKELKQYNIKSEIVYIPNYVSKEKFFIKKRKDKKFKVLSVGQIQTRKGVLDFIKVAKKLPDIEFIWAGGFSFKNITDGYKELKKEVEKPIKNVKFLGIIPREEMNDVYNECDLLFMPSYNELFPMTILEAVNLEKPLLLRDLELYEDILFNKYIKNKNNDEFVKNILKLKNDKNYYKKYSIYSKEISEFYSKQNVLKLWEEFYSKTIKNL